MNQTPQNPLALIKGVVSARHREEIKFNGYTEALKVLEQHFAVYEQRLRVIVSPASYPDGEVLLSAANQGLEQLRSAVSGLKGLDPLSSPDRANSFVAEAESGFGLLVQLKEVTEEKKEEFIQAYEEFQQMEHETG